MNEIQIFNNSEFGQVRALEIDGTPWFVGKDVAEALGYERARNAITAHVDPEDKKGAPIQGVLGGTQEMTVINEKKLTMNDVYDMIDFICSHKQIGNHKPTYDDFIIRKAEICAEKRIGSR